MLVRDRVAVALYLAYLAAALPLVAFAVAQAVSA